MLLFINCMYIAHNKEAKISCVCGVWLWIPARLDIPFRSTFFSFLIYMMPKICSQDYHFSVPVCESRELRGFIFLTHHTKTMSCRIVVSNWEDWGWAHPAVLGPRSKGRIMLQAEKPITPVCISSQCLCKKPGACELVAGITVCQ